MKQRLVLAATACAANLGLLLAPVVLAGSSVAVLQGPGVAFLLVVTLFCLVDALAEANLAAPAGCVQEKTTDRLALASGVALLLIFWLCLFALASAPGERGPRESVALTIMLLGAGLRGAAVYCLGSRFRTEVVVPRSAQLMDRGIFALVRHPSEVGLLLMAAGSAIFSGSEAALLVALVVLLPLSLWRLRREEAALHLAWGARFVRYRRRVPGLVPGAKLLARLTAKLTRHARRIYHT
jgi:protein-S-isoprenylcysteine O-methyltransferase Ste14